LASKSSGSRVRGIRWILSAGNQSQPRRLRPGEAAAPDVPWTGGCGATSGPV